MISSTKSPKGKSELVKSITQLPSNTKFEVIEVYSMKDKPKVNKTFDNTMRKGPFTVLFIDGG